MSQSTPNFWQPPDMGRTGVVKTWSKGMRVGAITWVDVKELKSSCENNDDNNNDRNSNGSNDNNHDKVS